MSIKHCPFCGISLRAGDIPGREFLDDRQQGRVERALAGLDSADKGGVLFQADWKDFKRWIEGAIEGQMEKMAQPYIETFQNRDSKEEWNKRREVIELSYSGRPSEAPFHRFRKAVAALKSKQPTLSPQAKELHAKIVSLLEAWAPVVDRLMAWKPKLSQGRKPSGKPVKPVYQPPVSSLVDLDRVSRLVDAVTAEVKDALVEHLASNALRLVDLYFENRANAKESPYATLKRKGWMGILFDVERLVQLSPKTREYARVESIGEAAKAQARRDAEDIQRAYKAKMQAKLSSLIGRKGNLTKAEKLRVHVEQGTMIGALRFGFADDSGFTIRHAVVVSTSPRGRYFFRYPSTFHDVRFPDGSRKATLSERQMHEMFVGPVNGS